MDIQPLLAALTRHKLIAILLALLVALTCAIVCNVAFMIQQHLVRIGLPSGVPENELVTLQSTVLSHDSQPVAQHREDLAALRNIPGVQAAAAMDNIPFGLSDTSYGICATEQGLMHAASSGALAGSCTVASVYDGTPGFVRTLGPRLVAGRDFIASDFVDSGKTDPPAAIITRALSHKLYPQGDALGKVFYADPGQPIRIVGIVGRLMRPQVYATGLNNLSMLWPVRPAHKAVTYVLRTAPVNRARVLQQATRVLYRVDDNRMVNDAMTFTTMRARYFEGDRTMIGLLIASALGMMLVAALGITGLASFWVQARSRSVGIRRALGARRVDIRHYFQAENFLVVTVGVILGVVLAIGLNLLLMHFYQLSRLPLWYLSVGAVALWILGQLAVLAPALRASRVPPVVAMRSA